MERERTREQSQASVPHETEALPLHPRADVVRPDLSRYNPRARIADPGTSVNGPVAEAMGDREQSDRGASALTHTRKSAVAASCFTLMELVVAASVLAILMGCCYTSIRLLHRLQEKSTMENRALLVLDNVVERLAAERRCDLDTVQHLLDTEFKRSELAQRTGVRRQCRRSGDAVELLISGSAGRSLAKLRIPTSE